MILQTLVLALREIRRNLMRSGLTALGIVIGVASVIAMVTLGEGASASIARDIAALGHNLLIVSPGTQRHGPVGGSATPFDRADERALRQALGEMAIIAPAASQQALAVFGNKNYTTTVTGTTNDFFTVRNLTLASGRLFHETELQRGAPVCVLGETVRRELFPHQDPLGASLRVGTIACEVIALVEPKGQAAFGPDQDDFIIMPIGAVQRRIAGSTDIGMFFLSARDDNGILRLQNEATLLLRQRRHIQPGQTDDFTVRDMQEIAKTMSSVTGVLTALLGAVAAVSLLVGGIGIMNIMLVAVTERTREIGIRLAIGARGREVLWQFLVEAAVLSASGGLIGIGFGLAASFAATHALSLPFVVLPNIIIIAFVFSAAVGIAFGFFPARKAARLNPIEALRYE